MGDFFVYAMTDNANRDSEIFLGFFKDGPSDLYLDDIFSSSPERDSSPSSNEASPLPADAFQPFFSSEGTFFDEIDMFPDSSIAIPPPVSQAKQETSNSEQPIVCNNVQPPVVVKKEKKLTGRKRTTRPKDPVTPSLLSQGEKLTNLSSQKLEEYVKSLSATRPLTPEEEKQLKKQRRLIKNRESAQLSRQKKKQYVEDLEKTVQSLRSENNALNEQVGNLTLRNQQLEEQVTYLKSCFDNKQLLSSNDNLFNKKSAATAGLCMFVVLFSFGLLFSASSPQSNVVGLRTQSVYHGRTLSEFPAIEAPKDLPQIGSKRHREYDEALPQTKRARGDSGNYVSPWIESEPMDDVDFTLTIGASKNQDIIQSQSNVPVVVQQQPSQVKPSNTSFIYCPEAFEVTSNVVSTPQNMNEPPVITVLLPAGVLNGTMPLINDMVDNPDESLFEVSCQVLNITVFPYFPTADHLVSGRNLL